ncbi:MAG: hypothetical protein LBG27_10845 [Spirochaetaceae bacterium]|jgi:hypothetical protein|nr:hypothetical protein [Spirochaetaceae bacterium]
MAEWTIMMLSKWERDLFFQVWRGLLSFVNERYGIDPSFGYPKKAGAVNSRRTVFQLRNKLWENDSIIDDYIQETKLYSAHKNILYRWKKRIDKRFVIIKYFRKYALLGDEDNNLYRVLGISNPIEECFENGETPPIIAHTSLLPFNNKIIYDSFLKIENADVEEKFKIIYEKNKDTEVNEESIITRIKV